MNDTYSPTVVHKLPPAIELLSHDFARAALYLLIPTELMYFSLYFKIKGFTRAYAYLTFLSILSFWIYPLITPIRCGPMRSLQYFAIAIGTMKMLDIWARRKSPPTYVAGPIPSDWLLPLILLTELRYESFKPNHIRVPRDQENFSEPMQLCVHLAAFIFLQSLPQVFPTVLAFEVLLSIYIIWTSLQLVVRYKTSPALFGPLYRADSLTGFWSETWHNAFASPCSSLAYEPIRYALRLLGAPVPLARAFGVLGAFGLMAIFHVYALSPIMDSNGLFRIGMFFLLNGVATVIEAMVWGHKKHWLRMVLAWIFEVTIATWTAEAARIPNGLSKIPWREFCDSR